MVLDTVHELLSSSYKTDIFVGRIEKKMFYAVQIHERIPIDEGAFFRHKVYDTLNDPRGWGIPFQHTDLHTLLQLPKEKVFIIRLTPPDELYKKYAEFKERQLSVANMVDRVIDINHCRWTEQCPNKSHLPLEEYQQYVILHEVGHMMGKKHPDTDDLTYQTKAPVMMQQTLGIRHFSPNPWPTEFDKNVL